MKVYQVIELNQFYLKVLIDNISNKKRGLKKSSLVYINST